MEEENNINYKHTAYILNIIYNKLENLDNSMRAFQDTLKRSILIDGKTIQEATIEDIIATLNDVEKNLTNDIIPVVKNEISD